MERFKNQNWQMKTGAILILIGALSIFPENDTWIHTTLQITFITGCILFVYGGSLAKKGLNSTVAGALVMLFALLDSVSAQDYSQQIEAFKQSFVEKSVDPLKFFISPELAFFTYPASATQQILSQVFSNLPKLNSIQIIESNMGEAQVRYNFTGLGERNSSIQFDEQGQITKINLIDNLLEEQAKAQAALAEQVQQPNPGDLAKKFSPEKVEFSSVDGLTISGDLYEVDPSAPIILLSHSGDSNKYEYADIAPKMNYLGAEPTRYLLKTFNYLSNIEFILECPPSKGAMGDDQLCF